MLASLTIRVVQTTQRYHNKDIVRHGYGQNIVIYLQKYEYAKATSTQWLVNQLIAYHSWRQYKYVSLNHVAVNMAITGRFREESNDYYINKE